MAGLSHYLTLGAEDVHVWRASLDVTATIVAALRQFLSANELVRAGRFHFESDRKHFIVARGYLRAILSRYLKIPAEEIKFVYGEQGSFLFERNAERLAS